MVSRIRDNRVGPHSHNQQLAKPRTGTTQLQLLSREMGLGFGRRSDILNLFRMSLTDNFLNWVSETVNLTRSLLSGRLSDKGLSSL